MSMLTCKREYRKEISLTEVERADLTRRHWQVWLVPCDGEGPQILICKSTINYSAASFNMKCFWVYNLL